MSLIPVEDEIENLISSILLSRLSPEEAKLLTEDLVYIANLPTVSVYSITIDNDTKGFILVSLVEDYDEFGNETSDLMLIEEIWVSAEPNDLVHFSNEIVRSIEQISKEKNASSVEVMVTESSSWLKQGLENYGFRIEEIHAKKFIPFESYVHDIFELINQYLPFPKVIQISAVRGDEDLIEFVDEVEEIDEILSNGWKPEFFHVVLEPDVEDIKTLIDDTNDPIKWDEIETVYRKDR